MRYCMLVLIDVTWSCSGVSRTAVDEEGCIPDPDGPTTNMYATWGVLKAVSCISTGPSCQLGTGKILGWNSDAPTVLRPTSILTWEPAAMPLATAEYSEEEPVGPKEALPVPAAPK